MSDRLNHVEENKKETQPLIGLEYEQLQPLIQNAERSDHEKQATLESKKVRIIAGGGGRNQNYLLDLSINELCVAQNSCRDLKFKVSTFFFRDV